MLEDGSWSRVLLLPVTRVQGVSVLLVVSTGAWFCKPVSISKSLPDKQYDNEILGGVFWLDSFFFPTYHLACLFLSSDRDELLFCAWHKG